MAWSRGKAQTLTWKWVQFTRSSSLSSDGYLAWVGESNDGWSQCWLHYPFICQGQRNRWILLHLLHATSGLNGYSLLQQSNVNAAIPFTENIIICITLVTWSVSGGQVFHSPAPYSSQGLHRPRSLVRPPEVDTEGDPQHTVCLLHEPHSWIFYHWCSSTGLFTVRICVYIKNKFDNAM